MTYAQRKGDERKLRQERNQIKLEYLAKQYGFYTGHMNQVFNYYLVAMGLVANAFVLSVAGPTPLSDYGSIGIALSGAALSLCFALLHWRAFQIADVLDDKLLNTELEFEIGFMTGRKESQRKKLDGIERKLQLKNTELFGAVYAIFIIAFLVAASCIGHLRGVERPNGATVEISVSQSIVRSHETQPAAVQVPETEPSNTAEGQE